MQIRFLGTLLLITAPTLLAAYASDSKKLGQEAIEQALQGNEDIQQRVQKREEGRKIQKKGKQVQKTVKEVTKPLKGAGTVAGNVATATGDVHAKMAAAAFRLAISTAQGLGEGIGAIIIGVGRYKERSQEILSITEALVEDAIKSEAKIASLEKKQKALLDLDKTPEQSCNLYFMPKDSKIDADHTPALKEIGSRQYSLFVRKKNGSVSDALDPQKLKIDVDGWIKLWDNKEVSKTISLSCNNSIMRDIISKGGHALQSPSNLDKLTKGLSNVYKGRTSIQRKAREATDIFTDTKAEREGKLKDIQAALKTENENYLEIIRVLQIKLMQETIKEIDRKLDIDKTIRKLAADQEFYKKSKKNITTEDKSLAKKELENITKEEARTTKELAYYQDLKLRKAPEIDPEKLGKDKGDLIAKINELVPLTKLGGSIYLQEKGLDTGNLVRRESIIGIYREIDKLKEQTGQIDDLKKRLEALEKVKDIPAKISTPSSSVPVSPQLSEEPSGRASQRRLPEPLQAKPSSPKRPNSPPAYQVLPRDK